MPIRIFLIGITLSTLTEDPSIVGWQDIFLAGFPFHVHSNTSKVHGCQRVAHKKQFLPKISVLLEK
jgi:hypothetical protein